MKSDLEPCIKGLALKYRSLYKKSLEQSLKWAKEHYKEYTKYIVYNTKTRKIETNENYIYKEFIFQGFIDIRKFKKKDGFNYLISNKPIKGVKLIYPVHAARNIDLIKEGYPNIYDLVDRVGVQGYTRTDIKF